MSEGVFKDLATDIDKDQLIDSIKLLDIDGVFAGFGILRERVPFLEIVEPDHVGFAMGT